MGTLISLFLPLLHLPVILRSAPVEKCHRDLKVLKISSPTSFQAEIPANVGLLLFFPTFSPWEAVPWCSEVPAALPAVLLELCRALRRNFLEEFSAGLGMQSSTISWLLLAQGICARGCWKGKAQLERGRGSLAWK